MKASDWIDQVKTALNLPSDYAAAKALGVSRALVSKYRGPTPTFDEDTAIKVASALKINPAGVILDQAAERTKNPDIRASLSREAERLCILCKVTNAIKRIAGCAMPTRRSTDLVLFSGV